MRERGFLRADGLVLMVLLLVSVGILGWVAYEMHKQSKAQRKVVEARPERQVAAAPEARATEEGEGLEEGSAGEARGGAGEAVAGGGGSGEVEVGGAVAASELAYYSNAVATLRAQLALVEEARARERAELEEKLRRELEGLREELARQQTQAFLAERELMRANLRVDAAEEALRRAERELSAKQEEIQRLRRMIEELSGAEPPVFQPAASTNAAVEGVRTGWWEASAQLTRRVGEQTAKVGGSLRDVSTEDYSKISAAVTLTEVGESQRAVKVLADKEQVSAPAVSAPELPRSLETGKGEIVEGTEVKKPRERAQRGEVAKVTGAGGAEPETKVGEVREARVEREDLTSGGDEEDVLFGVEAWKEVESEEEVLATPSREVLNNVNRARPEFRPEGGQKPSVAGLVQGGYRVVCAPLMAPYGVYSGVASTFEDDPEVGARTNYVVFGAGELLAFPLRMGMNVVAGAGAGSMDAVVGCLDVVTLGTYEGTNSKPHLIEVIQDAE